MNCIVDECNNKGKYFSERICRKHKDLGYSVDYADQVAPLTCSKCNMEPAKKSKGYLICTKCRVCSINGCNNYMDYPASELCKFHYQRIKNFGRDSVYCISCSNALKPSECNRRRESQEGLCDQCQSCSVQNCQDKYWQQDLCLKHFTRFYRTGSTEILYKRCKVERCYEAVKSSNALYCPTHRVITRREINDFSTRVRRRNLKGRFERYFKSQVIDIDGWTCYLCCQPIDKGDEHLDHIIPVVSGGFDRISNVAMTHSLCNLKKNKKPLSAIVQEFPNIKLPERFVLYEVS